MISYPRVRNPQTRGLLSLSSIGISYLGLSLTPSALVQIIDETVEILPEDALRVMAMVRRIDEIIQLVEGTE